MNEQNDFTLVPRSQTAIEKAEPGAKRVLAGMVADALALAKPGQIATGRSKTRPLRIVHVDDEDFMFNIVSKFVREKYQDVIIATFQNGDKAWEDLSREDPDLLITDLLNTNIPGRTQQIARSEFGMSGYELLPLLAKKKVNYPILVLSGSLSKDGYEGRARGYAGPNLNISFLKKPCTSEQLLAELSRLLGSALSYE
ncbi:MAG: response regulator [Lacunisphaera sp.]